MTGVQRMTNSIIVFLVGIASATAVFLVLKRWNPGWYPLTGTDLLGRIRKT